MIFILRFLPLDALGPASEQSERTASIGIPRSLGFDTVLHFVPNLLTGCDLSNNLPRRSLGLQVNLIIFENYIDCGLQITYSTH